MADEGAWRSRYTRRQVARTWALLATAATIIGVLRDMYGAVQSIVDSAQTRQQPNTAGYPQCETALEYQTLPPEGLAIMVVIVAAARGARQDEGCVRAKHIAVGTASTQREGDLEPLIPIGTRRATPQHPVLPRRTRHCRVHRIRRRPLRTSPSRRCGDEGLKPLERAEYPEVIFGPHLHDVHESGKACFSSPPVPRHYMGAVETDDESERGVSHTTDTGTNHMPRDGALDRPTPAVWGDTQRSGLSSRGAAGPPERWGGGDRDNQQGGKSEKAKCPRAHPLAMRGTKAHAGTEAADDGIEDAAVQYRAVVGDREKANAQEQRCIFINTGPKTIAIHLRTAHTLVDYVRDQVAAREGIATAHHSLMYAGKQLTMGDLTLEDYGVTEKSTLHLCGRVRGGMPEAGGDGSSSSKRPRLAFEDPMDVEAAGLDPLYAQRKVWFETCAAIATTFLAPEPKAAQALGYRERATRQGLTEAGVQEMVHWSAPHKPDHEVLLALATYEKATPYKVDLLQGKWVEVPKPPQGQPQEQPQAAPEVDPVQKEIADLEAQLAELRMPKIPLCSEEQLKAVRDKAMQTGMERDLVAALQAYGATPMARPEDAAKAGEVLRAAVWTTLYLTVTTRALQPAPQPVPIAPVAH